MAPSNPPLVKQAQEQQPQKKVQVWFQDEARFGQQGTLTKVWARKGSRPVAVKQTEYQWVYLFAAVNPVTGESSALLAPTVHTDYMNEHLRFISREAGPNTHVILVLDQAGWHMSKGLKLPENITLHHLPPYSPELNPIERVWAYLKSHYLANRVFTDYADLFAAGRDAWNALTESDLQDNCHTSWITTQY